MYTSCYSVTLQGFGDVSHLKYSTDDSLSLQEELYGNQVLIQVKACGLSRLDIEVRKGIHKKITGTTPFVPGYEISGTVLKIGPEVRNCQIRDDVIALMPLDTKHGGYCEYVVLPDFLLVRKPQKISHEEAVSALLAGLNAYTSLFYKLRILAGDFLLVFNSTTIEAQIALQLATHCGVKIIAVAQSTNDANLLETLSSCLPFPLVRIIDLEAGEDVLQIVIEETGSLGVDYVLDYSTCYSLSNSEEDESRKTQSLKRRQDEIIRSLRVHGTWIAFTPVQLNPLESELLLLKGATLGFVFEQAWLLSSSHLGQYLHILQDLMKKLGSSTIKPPSIETYSLKDIHLGHQAVLTNPSTKYVINDFGLKQPESRK